MKKKKNVTIQQNSARMVKTDDVKKEIIKNYNSKSPQISGHPYIILIIGGSGAGKTNSLFNLISQQTYIDKM